ncbi:MAG: hypothetical protein QXD62_00230, partial [Candidatus Woesearchaeota archaeon]
KPGVLRIDEDIELLRKLCEKSDQKNVLIINDKNQFVFVGDENLYNELASKKLVKGGGKEIKQGIIDSNKLNEIEDIFKKFLKKNI